MKLPDLLMGIFLAVSAALLNATIGIFSKVLMEQGLSVQHFALPYRVYQTDCGYFKKERDNLAVAVKSRNLCFFRNLHFVFL